LLKTGKHKVTAITRADGGSQIPHGVAAKKVDYTNEQSIVDALKGQDIFIITMAVTAAPDTHRKLVDAAAKAGVPWVVPNEFGGDTNNDTMNQAIMLGVAKKAERQHIEELGMSWIGVACGFWYEFSLSGGTDRYGADINNRKFLFFGDGNAKMDTTTFPQVGRAVAAVLSLPLLPQDENDKSLTLEDYRNKFVRINSFNLTQQEMFAALQKATNTTEKDWSVSSTDVKEYYETAAKEVQGGNFMAFARMLYGRSFYPDEPANMTKHYGLDNVKLGLPKEDLAEWTKTAVQMAQDGYIEKQYARITRPTGVPGEER
jgi:NmrA-like family